MSPRAGALLTEEIMPIIVAVVPGQVRPVACEDHAELIQDALATAAMMLEALERAGKEPIAKSVAYYSVQRVKSGRRSYGSGRTDVLSAAAQLDGRAVMMSLDDVDDRQDEHHDGMSLGDQLAATVEDPATIAARSVDWDELEDHLDRRECQVVQGLSIGQGSSELARSFRVSPARVTQIKRDIGSKIRECWGDDALQDLGRMPTWKASLRHCRL